MASGLLVANRPYAPCYSTFHVDLCICIRFHSTGVEPHCIVHSLPTDVALGRLADLGQARRATAVATRYKNVIGWSFQADLALPLLLELSDATLHPGKLCLHHDILLLACATGQAQARWLREDDSQGR